MKNVTVSVPDDVYRNASVAATQQGTSISALVAEFLRGLAAKDAEFAGLERLQDRVAAEVTAFRAGDRLTRDEVHERGDR